MHEADRTMEAPVKQNPDLNLLLSGWGFAKLTHQRRKTLFLVGGISLAIHVAAMLIFGATVVLRSWMERPPVFVGQAPLKTYDPRTIEHKVKVSKRQRSSIRPALMPRLVAAKASSFTLPAIHIDPNVVRTAFQPKFTMVRGAALGPGIDSGYAPGGFGGGESIVNFFDIRSQGEKIVICVDVSISMIEEKTGGVEGFERVKRRLGGVIDDIGMRTLFNVVAFADAGQAFSDRMVPGTPENKRRAKEFLQPFNTKNNYGLSKGTLKSADIGRKANGGSTRLDLALTAAFLMGADTILIISDGIPRVGKELTDDQRAAWNARQEAWRKAHPAAPAAPGGNVAGGPAVAERVWQPPSITEDGGVQEGRWVTRAAGGGGASVPVPPEMPSALRWWTIEDFIEHFALLHEQCYAKKGRKPPVVHTIGYAIDEEGGAFLQAFTKKYSGAYRRLSKI
jgi:hypothetical protein